MDEFMTGSKTKEGSLANPYNTAARVDFSFMFKPPDCILTETIDKLSNLNVQEFIDMTLRPKQKLIEFIIMRFDLFAERLTKKRLIFREERRKLVTTLDAIVEYRRFLGFEGNLMRFELIQ